MSLYLTSDQKFLRGWIGLCYCTRELFANHLSGKYQSAREFDTEVLWLWLLLTARLFKIPSLTQERIIFYHKV